MHPIFYICTVLSDLSQVGALLTKEGGGWPEDVAKAIGLADEQPRDSLMQVSSDRSRIIAKPSPRPSPPAPSPPCTIPCTILRTIPCTTRRRARSSRSMGDTVYAGPNRSGVISEPEVTSHKLDRCDKFVILGSDGVWDRMSSQARAASRARTPLPSRQRG